MASNIFKEKKKNIIEVFRIKMKLPGWQKLSGGSQETEQGKSRNLLGIWGSPVHLLEQHFYEEKQYFYIHKAYDSSFATKMYNCWEKLFVFLIFFFSNAKWKSDFQGVLCGAQSAACKARKENWTLKYKGVLLYSQKPHEFVLVRAS